MLAVSQFTVHSVHSVLLSVIFNVIGISFFSVYDIICEAVILVFSSHINQGTK